MTPAEYLRTASEAEWLDDLQRRDLRDMADDLDAGVSSASVYRRVDDLLLHVTPTDSTHPAWEVWDGWQRVTA